MASQRVFAISTEDPSPCGPWISSTITIEGEDFSALCALFNEYYPRRRIVELLAAPMNTVLSPVAFIIEAEMRDEVLLTKEKAEALLDTIVAAASLRLPTLTEAMTSDEGFRASYSWDSSLKTFALHVICPNTYSLASELYSAIRSLHLPSAPLNSAYKGFVMQDKILGCSRCVPLYLGPNFQVLRGSSEEFRLTTARPQIGAVQVMSIPPLSVVGGASGRLFAGKPVWLVPVEHTVDFLAKMIRNKTREYDDILCDVVYTECRTLSDAALQKMIGMHPRPEMKEKSVRFLYWIAKRVCPEEYTQWIYEQSALIAYQFAHEAVTDELLQRLFLLSVEGEYVSVVDGRDVNGAPTLYYFKNIWRVDKSMRRLGEAIPRLLNVFVGGDLKSYMQKHDQMEIYNGMAEEVIRLNYSTSLRSRTIGAVAKMLLEELKFNEDPNLLGCSNIVVELKPRNAESRAGRPEDLVSMSTHIHYKKYSDAECVEVKTLFRKLFSDQELRSWFFRLMCSMLWGVNPERSFYILFGCAKNGKSGILNLMEQVLGDYFGRFSSKAFEERSDPSSTNPELAAMHGKRAVASSETKAGAQMGADVFKAATGDDGISVRGLYQDPRVLRMQAKIFIATNHFPMFSNADKALRDRTVLILMESFFDNYRVPATELDQYQASHIPADTNFIETNQRIAPIMLCMMVDGFADYKLLGLEPKPKKVVDLTQNYWYEVGIQNRFIADCLVFIDSGDEQSSDLPLPTVAASRPKLTYTACYDRFVAWAASRGTDITKYPRFTFKSLMDTELASLREHKIEFTVDGWIGCKLKV